VLAVGSCPFPHELYSPTFREGLFSETRLPPNIILGNSGHEEEPGLIDPRSLPYGLADPLRG
jgi:hypothetical protein